jgi:hypothetical protein
MKNSTIPLILFVVLSLTTHLIAENAVTINIEKDATGGILLDYRFDEPDFGTVFIEGKNFLTVLLGKESLIKRKGEPELPGVCRSVIIPDNARMKVNIIDSSYYEIADIDIAPSKGILPRTVNPGEVAYTFANTYQKDAFYPGTVASLGKPYIMRDHRGLVVTVNPLQYNPVRRTLKVFKKIKLEIVTVGKADVNALGRRGSPRKQSRAFDTIYKSHFINYTPTTRYAPLDEEGDMLIIYHDPWLENIQPIIEHKKVIGIQGAAVAVSTIGNDADLIKSYIQNIYDTSDLAFVLLVGDAEQVVPPTTRKGEAIDPTYSLLSGADSYPDIIVGRFSAETPDEVDTQVLRTIEYEATQSTTKDWFKKGTGIGSEEGTGDDGEYDWEHIDYIRDDLLAYGYTEVDQIYGAEASAADVTAALDAGRGIINYCGHGSASSWGTTGFSTTHVNALVNDNMLPFIFSVACVNGEFEGQTCFAEAWLRATNGTEPTGAIGIYAASVNQSWSPPMAAQDEFVDRLVAESYFSFGALCFAASCLMMDEYGDAGVDMFNTWHIFGDPSLRVFGIVQRDEDPPTPNPSTWAQLPHATGDASIAMTATTATDPSGVEYYFTCTSGEGHDSGWQKNSTYEDTNLAPETEYTYTVTARDTCTNLNETASSEPASATTNPPDYDVPAPNPMTWDIEPYTAEATSISMTATTATDSSGVEYYFTCISGDGNDSGWQSSTTYTDTNLALGTEYTYTIKARDKSSNQNETLASQGASATTEISTANIANADIFVSGSTTNTYIMTHTSNAIYQSIEEVQMNIVPPKDNYSYLEHKWTIDVTDGDIVTFFVEAHHTVNSEGDDFVFAYSTDDLTYTDMLTVTKTADDNTPQSYPLPADTSGTIYIRVTDTDRSAGNMLLDTIYIDNMYVLSEVVPLQPSPLSDFAVISQYWLQNGCDLCGGADLTGDGAVNFEDLLSFIDNWLFGI